MLDPRPAPGLRQSLQTLASTCLAIAHTRLALLAVDLEEGRNETLILLAGVLAALLLGGVALGLFSVAVVLAFWNTDRVLTLCVLAAAYALISLGLGLGCVRRVRASQGWFRSSLDELEQDRGHGAR